VSPARDRGDSGEKYVVTIDGRDSDVLPRTRAMDRGKYNGETLGKTVEVRRLRQGRTTVLVAAWKDGEQTK
jgi:hypothetical protein